MKKIDKVMEHKDEYIIQKILEHKGLIRQALDYLNKEEDGEDENTKYIPDNL